MSKLVCMEITNFMSVGYAKIEFDGCNIVSLCGYNNVGKSALTRSAEIMLYNAYSTDQAKFIKDGADYWKVSWSFDDGVKVDRYKHLDGKSVWEMSKDGVEIFTNKVGTSVASMQDIPEVIANYLGVVKDEHTGEQLNVRRNTDRLFLINTTGGDNYKILNSILKSDVLAEASKSLNEDKNKLQSKMQGLRTSCDTLKEESNNLDIAPKVVVDDLKASIHTLEYTKGKFEGVSKVKNALDEHNSIVVYDALEPVDVDRLNAISRLRGLKEEADVVISPKVNEISTDRLLDIDRIKKLKSQKDEVVPDELELITIDRLNDISKVKSLYEATTPVIPPTLTEIDTEPLVRLSRIKGIISEYTGIINNLSGVENRLKEVNAQLKEFEAKGYKICGNCGSAVI